MKTRPQLTRWRDELFCEVRGVFYRSVASAQKARALAGSSAAGRYSAPDQPTLYMSASLEGVAAAMHAHETPGLAREICRIKVDAKAIFDLRDEIARTRGGINLAHALAPWRSVAASGGRPSSWHVRDRLEELGACGLVDPSRTAPGLWHLVLFAWNVPGAPAVEMIGA